MEDTTAIGENTAGTGMVGMAGNAVAMTVKTVATVVVVVAATKKIAVVTEAVAVGVTMGGGEVERSMCCVPGMRYKDCSYVCFQKCTNFYQSDRRL